MGQYIEQVRFRKSSDIRRRYPILEAVEHDRVLFDMTASDEGVTELAIHAGAANAIFRLEDFKRFLDEGLKKLKEEMSAADAQDS